MPDVDLDFSDARIDEVIEYVREKYGEEYVCKIGTFGTLSAKAGIKDLARVFKYDFQKTNSITKKITEIGITIDEILEKYQEVSELVKNDETFAKIVDYAKRIEGLQRHTSKHAAGIIISPIPITDIMPTKGKGADVTCMYPMGEAEALGLVKMDFLKLRTLSIIKRAVDTIEEDLGIEIDIDNIDFEDPLVFEQFQEGNTSAVFQMESPGMRSLLKRQKPNSIEDLATANALYRPGPLDFILDQEGHPGHGKSMVDIYLERKMGLMEVEYDHPLLKEVQEVTLGIFVTQEQVMRSSVVLAGHTLAESDQLRKVVGKKLLDKMPEEREKFVKGCMNNPEYLSQCPDGKDPEKLANYIFDQIQTFGRYGFNLSHSTAYAIICYQSMYLKTYYPDYFMASVLTSYIGSKVEDTIPYLNECRRLGLKLLPPDINKGAKEFTVSSDRKGIHYSINGVKGVGVGAVNKILEVREKHQFRTLIDFITMTSNPVNKTVITALAKSGAFDSFGYNRRTMVKIVEDLIAINTKVKTRIANNKKRKNPIQDISSFYNPLFEYEPEILEEYPLAELCQMEKELTGFYITHHPLDGLIEYIQRKSTHASHVINNGEPVQGMDVAEGEEEYEKLPAGQTVITGGVISSVKETVVKSGRNKGKTMATFVLEDAYQGDINCTLFVKQYEELKSMVRVGNLIFIEGGVDYFNDNSQLNIRKMVEIDREAVINKKNQELLMEVMNVQDSIDKIEESIEILSNDLDLIVEFANELVLLHKRLEGLERQLGEGGRGVGVA